MKTLMAWLAGLTLALGAATAPRAETIFQSTDNLNSRPDLMTLCSGCTGMYQAFGGFRSETSAYIDSIDVVVRAFAGACCYLDDRFIVEIYEGPADRDGTLIYSQRIGPYGTGAGPLDHIVAPPKMFEWEAALVRFAMPSLLIRKDRDYTISFVDYNFHLPVFRTGNSPLYTDGGPGFPDIPRDRFSYPFYSGGQNQDGALGFRLNGTAAVVPEPATWALMILGFALAMQRLRRDRAALAR